VYYRPRKRIPHRDFITWRQKHIRSSADIARQ